MPIESRHVLLRDGRRLAYAEYGAPRGRPVLYFHGLPGSRLEAGFAAPAAEALGVRLLAVDRPGVGRSDRRPGRTLVDWPDDVAQLADALGLARFVLLGVSGGGPSTAACAWKIPERLDAVALVCPVAPLDRPGSTRGMSPVARFHLTLARRAPALLPPLGAALAPLIRAWPAGPLALMRSVSSPPDRAALARSEAGAILGRGLSEAFRRGAGGAIDDLRLLVRPWGFAPADIRVPVHLWHGEQDRTVPQAMGRRLASAIPGCRSHLLPDDGHFSLPIRHVGEILRHLLAG